MTEDHITDDELNQAQWHQQVDFEERRRRLADAWSNLKAELEWSPYADKQTKEDMAEVERELNQLF